LWEKKERVGWQPTTRFPKRPERITRASAFADAGIDADPHQSTKSIASAGAGLRGDITRHVQFRCEVAFPFTDHLNPRLHVAAVLKF
jgi:hypothetical protein